MPSFWHLKLLKVGVYKNFNISDFKKFRKDEDFMSKVKFKGRMLKKILAFILTALMVVTTIPLTTFAAGMNLGDVDNNKNIPISVSMHYGHELHTTTVNGQTYPLFCIEYGKSSPNSSTLGTQGAPTDSKVLEAARWIFAGYYMKHGNSIDWLDMAYTQKKAWSVLGWETSWSFSSSGYDEWIANAETNMKNLNTYPSFDGTDITGSEPYLAGSTHTITDTNGVLKDYPAFTQDSNGVKIVHEANSNSITIKIEQDCTQTFFALNGNYYKTITGDANNCLLYAPASGGTQKLMYSAYYDPIDIYFEGSITPLGDIELTKQDIYGAGVDGTKFGLYKDKACTNRIATATSNNAKVKFEDLAPGTYFVKETQASDGFLISDEVITVTVNSNQTSTKTIKNTEPTGSITITKNLDLSKTNDRYGDVKIKEAEYTLYAAETIKSKTGSKTFYQKDEIVKKGNITANSDGKSGTITWDNLPLGSYYIKETSNPEGTFIDSNVYKVTLSYKDQVTPVIVDNSTTSSDVVKSMKLKLFKAGTSGTAGEMKGLEGAEFTIKLYADYLSALDKGYTYEEIWAFKDSKGTWKGLNESGDVVVVDSSRAEQANKVAPSYDVITTDKNGIAVSDYLPYGKYIGKETVTPVDYSSGADFTFSITEDETEVAVENKVKYIAINNAPFEAPVKIVKKDVDSDKIVTLSSATFKIKAAEDIYDTGSGKLLYSEGEFIQYKVGSNKFSEFMTNSDDFVVPAVGEIYATTNDEKGTVITPFKLPAGNYEIVEITNPEGFLIAEDSVPFTITSIYDYDKDSDGDTVVSVTVKNEQPKAQIIINKSFFERENIDKTLIENIDYTKIAFELKAASDIIDMSDGSIVYKADEIIDTYYLNADATLTIDNLWIGDYTFKEVSTIDGAALDDTVYKASFTVEDNTTKVYTSTFNIVNYTTEVDISKVDITGEKEIEGAELTVLDDTGNIIDSWVSSTESHKIEGLKVGETYTLREDYAPDTYVIANEIQFTVENTKDIQTVKMLDKQVAVNKVDVNGNPITDAELTVTNTKTKQIVDKWITTEENHFISGLIEGQSYVITETSTPNGFVTASPVEFTVSPDKEIQYISVVDKQLTVSKTDITTGEELEGAELTVTDSEGNVIDSWISTTEPHIVTGLVEGQTYILTEVTAPYGYELTESVEFTVSTDKQTQKVIMEDAPIVASVMVNKVDSATGENIISRDFEFTIYSDAECKNEITTVNANTEDGTALFDNLRYGTYYIKETKAPLGYELSDEVVEIIINDKGVFANGKELSEENGVYSFEYQNSLLPSLFTGDNNRTMMYVTMAIIAVVFIIIMIIIKKKAFKN